MARLRIGRAWLASGRRALEGLVGRTLDRYRLLEVIGQGGMSSVYRAQDMRGIRQVAVKILAPYLAQEIQSQARFAREIKLLLQLKHPNIVPILDFGEAHGLAYIVMPFISSGTLHDRLKAGPIDPESGARLIDQLASALSFAHANGVVHRDIKPSNVLIDVHGNALLSDFSFARTQDATQDLTGSALIGTPAYMSPEQCRGEPVDRRSDQYSFTVLLFQITTGQLPFEGDTPLALAMQHIRTPLPRPRTVNPKLPEEVELVLIRGLAKDPALRFESVEALNRAFQAAVAAALDPKRQPAADPTVMTPKAQELYRRYQNVRPAERGGRRRSVVMAAGLLVLVLIVSAAAVAVVNPSFLNSPTPLPPTEDPAVLATKYQATVDYLVAINETQQAQENNPGAQQTEVMRAVIATIEAQQATQAAQAPAP
jgi:serine/threonine-protein kinase